MVPAGTTSSIPYFTSRADISSLRWGNVCSRRFIGLDGSFSDGMAIVQFQVVSGVAPPGCHVSGRAAGLLVSEHHDACVDCGRKPHPERSMFAAETAVTPPGRPARLLNTPLARLIVFFTLLKAFQWIEGEVWTALGLPAGFVPFRDTTPLMEALRLGAIVRGYWV